MTRTCRVCGQPRHEKSSMPLCHAHLNEYRRAQDKRRRGPAKQRGGKYQPTCKLCGEPRREDIQYALCAEHYRDMLLQRARAKGVPARRYFDPQKCTRCDEPRTQYGSLCLACDRAAKEVKRREMGIAPWRPAKPKTCRICGAAGPLATATGKLCVACAGERSRRKVKKATQATRGTMPATRGTMPAITANQPPAAPVATRWQTALPGRGFGEAVVVGPEVFAPVEPVKPTRPVTRVRAADADEREAREREWAEWLQRRRTVARP